MIYEERDALLAFDGTASAGEIRCPVFVLGARDDAIVPAFLQEQLAAREAERDADRDPDQENGSRSCTANAALA